MNKRSTKGKRGFEFLREKSEFISNDDHNLCLEDQAVQHYRNLLFDNILSKTFIQNMGVYGLQPPRLLCPCDFSGKNTGEGHHSFLQGIFPMQELNPSLLHCRQILYCLSHKQGLNVNLLLNVNKDSFAIQVTVEYKHFT